VRGEKGKQRRGKNAPPLERGRARMAEDHIGGRSPSVIPTNVDHSLDDLARRLAGGTISRRKAVRLLGASLLGGALASVPGFAWAQNNACERYCRQNFPRGPERARCISQGAQGEGPCHRFGCCLCSEPTHPEFGGLACSPNVTSEQQCCDVCAAHPAAFTQCSFVSGPSPFTCAGPPGSECSVA
jgi:hypothetical protein